MEKFVIEPEGYAQFSFRVYSAEQDVFVECRPFVVDAGQACFALDAARDEAGADHMAFVAKVREYIAALGGPPADLLSVGHCLEFVSRVEEVASGMAKKKAPESPPRPGEPPSSGTTS